MKSLIVSLIISFASLNLSAQEKTLDEMFAAKKEELKVEEKRLEVKQKVEAALNQSAPELSQEQQAIKRGSSLNEDVYTPLTDYGRVKKAKNPPFHIPQYEEVVVEK